MECCTRIISSAYLEEGSDQVSLGSDALIPWESEELGERLVGWCEDGDVLGLAESLNEDRKSVV